MKSVSSPSQTASSSQNSSLPTTAFERGRALYLKDLGVGSCASCHGLDGKGVAGKGGSLIGCTSCKVPTALVTKIDATMPAGGANLCKGDCAVDTATYIFEYFNGGNFNLGCNSSIQKASPMRRLNKTELANAVKDVFGRGDNKIIAELPNEQEVIGGFATVGSALTTSRDWSDALLNAAINAADDIVAGGNFPKCATSVATQQCFTVATQAAGKLLFRRPLTTLEMTALTSLRAKEGDAGVIVSLLTSPKFVFSLAADNKQTARNLTGSEQADRLALTLWGSVPDNELIDLALANNLKGSVLDQQITRMINSPKFERFASVFVDAWIGLDGYHLKGSDLKITDVALTQLVNDMKTETRLFVAHIIKNNLPINEIYTANYSFLNSRLQAHYGFPVSTSATEFIKINFPANSNRKGLMTQAAVLAKAFDGTKTSVVKRGVLPLEAFTCTAPLPPTNSDIADQVNDQANSNASEKQKMALRASKSTCAACHAAIDPIGWVFSEFGIAGQSVNTDPDGDALNTSGNLFGKNFLNAHGMVDILVAENQFASCFASKFLIHSIGRKVSYANSNEDQCAINSAITVAKKNDKLGARDFINALMLSNISTTTGNIEEL